MAGPHSKYRSGSMIPTQSVDYDVINSRSTQMINWIPLYRMSEPMSEPDIDWNYERWWQTGNRESTPSNQHQKPPVFQSTSVFPAVTWHEAHWWTQVDRKSPTSETSPVKKPIGLDHAASC